MSTVLKRLRSASGAIDLMSIMVGAIVMLVLAAIIVASVFVVIPWAQDNAAKQSLDAVVTAQQVAKARTSSFANAQHLRSEGLLEADDSIQIDASTGCYFASSVSETGKKFFIDSNTSSPQSSPPNTCAPQIIFGERCSSDSRFSAQAQGLINSFSSQEYWDYMKARQEAEANPGDEAAAAREDQALNAVVTAPVYLDYIDKVRRVVDAVRQGNDPDLAELYNSYMDALKPMDGYESLNNVSGLTNRSAYLSAIEALAAGITEFCR